MTMVSAGAIQGKFLPNGGVQWLRMKPWTYSIGRCPPYRTVLHRRIRMAIETAHKVGEFFSVVDFL